MHHFTDDRGQLWCVRIDCAALDRIQRETSIYLPELLNDDLAPLAALLDDPLRIARVLYAACHRQAAERNVSFEDFASGLHGDHLAEAQQAFQGALCDFFPERRRREMLRLLFETATQIAADEHARALERLRSAQPRSEQSSQQQPSPA
jgi:hypothetical protein